MQVFFGGQFFLQAGFDFVDGTELHFRYQGKEVQVELVILLNARIELLFVGTHLRLLVDVIRVEDMQDFDAELSPV